MLSVVINKSTDLALAYIFTRITLIPYLIAKKRKCAKSKKTHITYTLCVKIVKKRMLTYDRDEKLRLERLCSAQLKYH